MNPVRSQGSTNGCLHASEALRSVLVAAGVRRGRDVGVGAEHKAERLVCNYYGDAPMGEHKARTRPASSSAVTASMLTGPSRRGHAPGRSAAHGRLLAGPVDPVRIPPLALDPYLVEQRYHRQHLRIFDVSIFVILDACLRPDQCWGVLAGLCDTRSCSRATPAREGAGERGRRRCWI
jgi:hypothetical protein